MKKILLLLICSHIIAQETLNETIIFESKNLVKFKNSLLFAISFRLAEFSTAFLLIRFEVTKNTIEKISKKDTKIKGLNFSILKIFVLINDK